MSRSSRAFRRVLRGTLAVGFVAAAAIAAPLGGGNRVIQAAGGPYGAGGEYHTLTPTRILDTRGPQSLDVEPFGPKSMRVPGVSNTFDVQVLGRSAAIDGLPAYVDGDQDGFDDNVLAVAVNITVVHPTAYGWLSAYGAGESPEDTSLLNFRPGDVNANSAILRPGREGKLTVLMVAGESKAEAHVVIDIVGWFSSSSHATRGARLVASGPDRILDTRPEYGGSGPILGGTSRALQVRGAAGVPNDPTVTGVMVNLTGVNNDANSAATFVSAVPAAPAVEPTTSNLNLRKGQIRANTAIVPLSPDGQIYLYNGHGSVHLAVDVVGYFRENPDDSSTGRVIPLVAPFRAFDTRLDEHGDQPLPPAYAEDWNFTDFANDVKVDGVGVGPQMAVIGNLTVAEAQRRFSWEPVQTYLTAYPTNGDPAQKPPTVSNINVFDGEPTVPNMALLRYGTGQQVRFYNLNGFTDYLFDATAVVLA